MKKIITCLFLGCLLASAPAFADTIELGFGLAPTPPDDKAKTDSIVDNSFKVLHVGYQFMGILYASLDSIIMPPHVIYAMTSTYDSTSGYYSEGVARPGMVNLMDAGLKIDIGSISVAAQVGVQNLYIYKFAEIKEQLTDLSADLGANIKAMAGYKLSQNLGFQVAGYSIQPSFKQAVDVLKGLFSEKKATQEKSVELLLKQAAYSVMVVLYL